MKIRLLQTVEDQITAMADEESAARPKPLNDVAARRGVEISRKAGDEVVTLTWLLPDDGEFEVSERQAKRLIDLGYAEAL